MLLSADNLGKVYGRRGLLPFGREPVHAVDGISFTVDGARTLSIVGESGCGKTTTARIVLGLEPATFGEVRFRGELATDLRGAARREYRRSVQAVFQDPTSALNPRRRVRSIIGEPLRVNHIGTRSEIEHR